VKWSGSPEVRRRIEAISNRKDARVRLSMTGCFVFMFPPAGVMSPHGF